MLIDDDPINNLLNTRLLSKHQSNIRFTEHNEGRSAIEDIKNRKADLPQVILLDINMPVMDGWQFLEEYQHLNYDIPLFMLTSSIAQEDIKKAKSYKEVKGFITKPLDQDKIRKIFASVQI